MILGIVGSRKRNSMKDIELILDKVHELNPDKIVSGGCPVGADAFAETIAHQLNIPFEEFLPNLDSNVPYYKIVQSYFARNMRVAENCDVLLALVAPDRKGGTENTIKWFLKINKEENLIIL